MTTVSQQGGGGKENVTHSAASRDTAHPLNKQPRRRQLTVSPTREQPSVFPRNDVPLLPVSQQQDGLQNAAEAYIFQEDLVGIHHRRDWEYTDHATKQYFQEMKQYAQLTVEEEESIGRKATFGDQDARRQLVLRNWRLVVAIANRYSNQNIPLLDLIQEGNIGMIRAADKFDYRKGENFGTYATWWIRQKVLHAVIEARNKIHIPSNVVGEARRIRRTAELILLATGEEATPEAIARELDTTAEHITEVSKLTGISIVSYDVPIRSGEETYRNFIDETIENIQSPDPQKKALLSELSDEVRKALATLTPRERFVIQARYGLLDGTEHKLEEIAKAVNRTYKRIGQIEERAIKKLRRVLLEMGISTDDF